MNIVWKVILAAVLGGGSAEVLASAGYGFEIQIAVTFAIGMAIRKM